eukprot:gene16341-22536_t
MSSSALRQSKAILLRGVSHAAASSARAAVAVYSSSDHSSTSASAASLLGPTNFSPRPHNLQPGGDTEGTQSTPTLSDHSHPVTLLFPVSSNTSVVPVLPQSTARPTSLRHSPPSPPSPAGLWRGFSSASQLPSKEGDPAQESLKNWNSALNDYTRLRREETLQSTQQQQQQLTGGQQQAVHDNQVHQQGPKGLQGQQHAGGLQQTDHANLGHPQPPAGNEHARSMVQRLFTVFKSRLPGGVLPDGVAATLMEFYRDTLLPKDRGWFFKLLQALAQWFSVGLLELRQINWTSCTAQLLERIMMYEKPLVILHTALAQNPASNVDEVLKADDITSVWLASKLNALPEVAVFYSISSTQPGLAGVELGNCLIKRTAEMLQ